MTGPKSFIAMRRILYASTRIITPMPKNIGKRIKLLDTPEEVEGPSSAAMLVFMTSGCFSGCFSTFFALLLAILSRQFNALGISGRRAYEQRFDSCLYEREWVLDTFDKIWELGVPTSTAKRRKRKNFSPSFSTQHKFPLLYSPSLSFPFSKS